MNATLRNPSIGALAAATALVAGACTNPASKPAFADDTAAYRTHDGRVVHYVVPPEAKLREVAVTKAGDRTTIRITTGAPMSRAGGPLAIDVHFSDRREVAFVRDFEYPSRDAFDGAAVLDCRTGAVLGEVDVVRDGNRLELAFDSALVTGQPRIAVSRYLPSRAALGEAQRGLEDAYATMYTFGTTGRMHVAVPFSRARRARSVDGAGTTNFEPVIPISDRSSALARGSSGRLYTRSRLAPSLSCCTAITRGAARTWTTIPGAGS
jgi:hypothetical protein